MMAGMGARPELAYSCPSLRFVNGKSGVLLGHMGENNVESGVGVLLKKASFPPTYRL